MGALLQMSQVVALFFVHVRAVRTPFVTTYENLSWPDFVCLKDGKVFGF